jgi:class 3 adenylate cyclase
VIGWLVFLIGCRLAIGAAVADLVWFGKWTGPRWVRRAGMQYFGGQKSDLTSMRAMSEHEPTLRTVTAMTAALAGYTSFSSAHEPEVVATTVQHFFEAATQVVLEQDGTLIGYHGSSLVAIWNAPHEQNDHALRVALAASAISGLDGLPGGLRASVGVATGPAMVGILGYGCWQADD